MPFPFVYLCDLLNDLERPYLRNTPLLPKDLTKYTKDKVIYWLRLHRDRLNAFSTDSQAVMSMLQPENQTDRVYGLDPGSLELVIARAQRLPRQHYQELQKWQTEPLGGDLAACVERVMANTKIIAVRAQANSVTVEEIDQCLLRIAAFNTSSSLAVRSLASTWKDADQTVLLGNLYQQLQAREAKWLTRVILKSYAPIKFPEDLEPGPQHSFLPNCVQLKIRFPSSAPAPVRRDGTRMIAGIGNVEAATHPPTLPRTAPQPPSSVPGPIPSTNHVPPTPPTAAPQLPSSSQRHVPSLNHLRPTPPTSSSPSGPVIVASPQHHPPTPSRTALSPISHNLLTSSPQKSPKTTRPSPSPSILTGGTGTCQIASHICPLSTCVFLLAPCISSVPYITENLLRSHGCRYFTSVPALAHPSLRQRCSRTCKRFRKIVLVESNRTQPTVDFLKRVGRLSLTKNGKKEWVEVYDWRLLECITKVDRGQELTFNPWDRCWIGAV